MKKDFISWMIFIALSFIWGSSFILMKVGLHRLTAFQVAAIRIASSGIVLFPLAIKFIKEIPRNKLLLVFLSGTIGNLIPAFLFCLAEQVIDSALTGTINSLTPIFVIVMGSIFFNTTATWAQITGVIISFTGTALLFLGKGSLHGTHDLLYVFYVVLATMLYGLNVNIVHKNLKDIASFHIVSVALSLNAILALIILYITGYFKLPFNDTEVLISTGAASVLGIVGTAIATILFYQLLKRAGTVFSSMVTYGMPAVAIFWGFVAKEDIGWGQIGCLVIILFGVYWTNRRKLKAA